MVFDRVDHRRGDLHGLQNSHDDHFVEHWAKPGGFENVRVANSAASAPDDQTSWRALGSSVIGCVTIRVAPESITT